jgi:AcrR family transcriptional regulator
VDVGVQARSELTRVRLIETAEALFAERGIEAVSLRDVCAVAGQRNHSAAQYHFGDRAGLVAAVYEHRMRVVNERRLARLATTAADDVVAIVDAIVCPLTSVVDETHGWYGRFLERTRWDTFARSVVSDLPVLAGFTQATVMLAATLDHLPPPRRAHRLDQAGTMLVATVAGWEWNRHRGAPALDVATLDIDLVNTFIAVLDAPLTADAGARRPARLETT